MKAILSLRSASQICDVVGSVASRALTVCLLAVVLFASAPAPLHASPDAPMCVAEEPYASAVPRDLIQWRMPMCGPFVMAVQTAEAEPPAERAVAAYRLASDAIVAANYEEARLQLDLAHRGLRRIRDRIASRGESIIHELWRITT